MGCKAVWQHLEHTFAGNGIGIDVDLAEPAIGPDVVHTANVVIVGMGHQYAVNASERVRQYLLAEVWATVYQQPCLCRLHQNGATQALVSGIRASADLTLAAYHRHATRCSCS